MRDTTIHKHFADLKDPRINRTRKHPLINIIFIALIAVICGAEDWVSIERFGKARRNWLKRFLDLKNGIPSHDTFNRVFSLLDSATFCKSFMMWAQTLADKVKKVVALDGKSLRATKDEINGLGPLHLVNVWCCENQLVLGQEAVSDKSNEITAIPLLLDMLEIEGAIITTDAMGCQKEICKKICEKEADYVISLKGNQGNLHKDVALYFKSIRSGQLKCEAMDHETIEKDHGRIEERKYYAMPLPEGLHSDGWKNLRTIVMVSSKRTTREKVEAEERYFISSLDANKIIDIAHAVRAHWQVENSLHWRLDVSFNEDRWRSKQGNAAANMALLNKMALNLLKKEQTSKVGVKNRRLLAGWDEEYLAKVILTAKN
jgi:predicted transposase YbfD/YdcC